MTSFANLPLRRKLITLFTVTALVTVLIACTILGIDQLLHSRKTLRIEISSLAQLIADSSAPALLFRDAAAANETLSLLRTDPRIKSACLASKSGLVLARLHTGGQGSECPQTGPEEMRFTGRDLLIVHPVLLKEEVIGTLYLDVSLKEMYRQLLHFAETGLCVLLLSSIFAFTLSSVLEKIISGPSFT